MSIDHILTLSEAGYVLGRSTSRLNKAVDAGEIKARQRKVGKIVERLLGPAELRFLRVADELDKDLTPAGRRRLYEALRKLADNVHSVRLGELELDLKSIDADLEERLGRLRGIRQQIEMGQGEAVIRDTNVPAHLIAALAQSQSLDEILADFPSLDARQVHAAVEYAKAYPKRGRPYSSRSLKRSLSDLAELGGFDESEANQDVVPRKIP